MNYSHFRRSAKFFNRAVAKYDKFAFLQQKINDELIKRLELIKHTPNKVIDIGASTSYATRKLEKIFPKADLFVLDLAQQMLLHGKKKAKWLTKQKFICADTAVIPLPNQSIDFIFSNLMLPWIEDISATFREWQRIIKPEGLLLFSTLGPDTLKELRNSWLKVDDLAHVNIFFDMHDIGDKLLREEFVNPVMDVQLYEVAYPSVLQLIRELKFVGSHNLNTAYKGLTGKQKFNGMLEAYKEYNNHSGKFGATFEVIFGHAWGADLQQFQNKRPHATIPVSKIMRWKDNS